MKKHTLLFFVFTFSLSIIKAQTGIITTVAGNGHGAYSGDGGEATAAEIYQDEGVAVDAAGNIYIADTRNNRIRKVATTGIISTIAGNGRAGYSGDGGQATLAECDYPICVRVDPNGTIYFSDNGNGVIRRVNTSGVISTYAGNGFGGYSGNGGLATAAEFGSPTGIGIDANHNIYIADQSNNVIRKVTYTTNIITTVAGRGPTFGGYSGNGGQATAADLNQPAGVAIAASGEMYIADFNNNVIRAVSPTGTISTFAGTTFAGYSGNEGLASATELYNPTGVSTNAVGDVYIADAGNGVVREVIVSSGQMYVIAGINDDGYSGDGGLAYLAEVNYPNDVMPDANNNVYIADLSNSRVRKITARCTIDTTTIAIYNYPACNGSTDGILNASSNSPFGPYIYSWTLSGNTNQELTGLSAGTYSVTITDGLECTATGSVTLTQPTAVGARTTIVSDVKCLGSRDGIASVSASGGESPYNYSWSSGGGSSATSSGLSAGTYTVTVADYTGCTATATTIITQPATAPSVTISAHSNASCFGGTGDATVNAATGGTSPYIYSWSSGGGTNLTASGLAAGTYTITASDNNGCNATASVIISQPTALSIDIINQTNVSCFGGTGSATANAAIGGTSPYHYSWSSGGGTNLTVLNLSAGNDTITATDNNGCTASASVVITQPTALSITISNQTNVTCFGGTGNATANVASGGTSPYTYNWSSGGGTNLVTSGLSAGTYIITAADNNGCTTSASVTITQPSTAVLISMSTFMNAPCFGGTGNAVANAASGGTPPYTYSWTSGEGTNLSASGLSPGTYTITAIDSLGCNALASVTITQPAEVTAFSTINTNVSCYGSSNGIATVLANGGTGAFTYSWTPSGGNLSTASGLAAGTYTISVTDNNGCNATTTAIITQPSMLTVAHDSVDQTSTPCNGIAEVLPGGGTEPYTYLWSAASQTNDTINNQCAGTYCCTITDNNGCTLTTCVTVNLSTGINNISDASIINIYPDPNTGYFTIAGVTQGQKIELYNYIGQEISSIRADNTTMHFNISDQPNGIYLIRILSKDRSLVSQKKIVKTK